MCLRESYLLNYIVRMQMPLYYSHQNELLIEWWWNLEILEYRTMTVSEHPICAYNKYSKSTTFPLYKFKDSIGHNMFYKNVTIEIKFLWIMGNQTYFLWEKNKRDKFTTITITATDY